MSTTVELVLRTVLIGGGATLVMDGWAAILRRFGVPSLNLALVGRWLGHAPHGRWIHTNMAQVAPVRWEGLIGWCAHYAIGVGFAGLLMAAYGLEWARSPRLAPALCLGVGTVLAPLLLLQPALGAGIASRKTPRPFFNSVKSLVTHCVFGLGLFLAATALAWLVPVTEVGK